jgi:hypothetical protein
MALYESLRQHCSSFTLWVLCLDQITKHRLREQRLPQLVLISLSELERATPGLAEARANRSKAEYYFTCSPALPLHILNSHAEIDIITYLDSDLFFYSNPECLFQQLGEGSVGLIRHRPAEGLEETEQYGIFNVSWISFRNDREGIACLHWWRERCLEWCYRRLDGDRYADQKYLDQFPKRFHNVVILEHEGANLAPWNIASHPIIEKDGQILINGKRLLFFHFQGLREITRYCYETGLGVYHVRIDRQTLRLVFEPYLKVLRRLSPQGIGHGLVYMSTQVGPLWKRMLRPIKEFPLNLGRLFRGERILWLFDRVV